MSKTRNFICIHCGKKMKIKASKGEPHAEICPKRSDGDLHVWIDCKELSAECRSRLSSSETPIAEYMYYTAHCNEANKNYQDMETTISLYQKAAKLGHLKAMVALGGIYIDGKYVSKDTEKALLWYRKSANAGNPDAMLALGCLYETGNNIPQDLKEAERWYREAFNSGDNLGKLGLGRLYELKGEQVKAAIIYEELAKIVTVPPSFIWVSSGPGTLPAHGFIFNVMNQTDEHNAYDLSRRGYAYENGTAGVEKNLEMAVYWYQKAATAGNSYAMYALGHIYSNDMSKDSKRAFVYFRQAAIIGCKKMCTSRKWESFQTAVEMNDKVIAFLDTNPHANLDTWEDIINWINDDIVIKSESVAKFPHASAIFIKKHSENSLEVIHKFYYKDEKNWYEDIGKRVVPIFVTPDLIRKKINEALDNEVEVTTELKVYLKNQ